MRRRDLLLAAPAAVLAGVWSAPGQAALAATGARSVEAYVRRQAQTLAAKPFQPPPRDLPTSLAVDYDGYRDIRFRPEKAVWRDLKLPFELQMFHRGGMVTDRVDIAEWVDGQAQHIAYSTDLFTFGRVTPGTLNADLGFAGFRIHAPINNPGYFDEVAVFLGASYFRAVAKDEVYGLSARGLSINAGEGPEEFPRFSSFVIERPAADATSLMVHALLDGPSLTGAYHIRITPGVTTRFDVTMSLFPRQPVYNVGIAPMTSMYLFGPEQPRRYDDFRPEVHDSDGLLIANGAGERIWRPLFNPQTTQISAFRDSGPKGFGLQQRNRDFGAYHDLEASYHRRPGAWVTPLAGFRRGDVRLVELPAKTETEDNIVASWRPTDPLQPGREHKFAYTLDWGLEPPAPVGVVPALRWRSGAVMDWKGGKPHVSARQFIVDFGPFPDGVDGLRAEVVASKGDVHHITLQPNASFGGARLGFEFEPRGAVVSDLRATLFRGPVPLTEVWIYRWLA